VSRTGMTVVGRVTGRHQIKDLRADVPFNVAVSFTNEQVLRSRDLQVAIQQDRELREELAAEREEKRMLQATLDALQGRMGDVLEAVERLGQGGVVQVIQGAPGAVQGPMSEDPAPMFVPEVERTEGEAHVAVKTSEGSSNVSQARSALRKLRSGQA
jgi:hypothetical protein